MASFSNLNCVVLCKLILQACVVFAVALLLCCVSTPTLRCAEILFRLLNALQFILNSGARRRWQCPPQFSKWTPHHCSLLLFNKPGSIPAPILVHV